VKTKFVTAALILALHAIAVAKPIETSLGKSPDGRHEVFLTGDQQEGRISYFDIVIRDTTSKKSIPIGEGFDFSGAVSLNSTSALWSPDSSMVALSVIMYREGWQAHSVLRRTVPSM
jgi:hypothetical protein